MPDVSFNMKMMNYIRHFRKGLLHFYDVVNENFWGRKKLH